MNALALIASHIENVSVEFRNLSRPEINEACEYFSKYQKDLLLCHISIILSDLKICVD